MILRAECPHMVPCRGRVALIAFVGVFSGYAAGTALQLHDACSASGGAGLCSLQLVHVSAEKVQGFNGKRGSVSLGRSSLWHAPRHRWNRSQSGRKFQPAPAPKDRKEVALAAKEPVGATPWWPSQSMLPLEAMQAGAAATESRLSSAGVVAIAAEECLDSNLSYWADKNERIAKMLTAWQERRPNGVIQLDDGEEGCADSNSSKYAFAASISIDGPGSAEFLETWRRVPKQTQMLNLIQHSPPDICLAEKETQHMDNYYDVPQRFFNISGKLLELAAVRSYGIVWPGRFACLQVRCPLVLSLQGASEHANFARNFYDFQMMGNTGLMRSVQKDPECVRTLRSVLIFPQLMKGESWVKDGPLLVEMFLIPLLREVVHRYDDMVDPNRVAILGYSEGAFGALQAATRYPHVFSVVCVIAASLSVPNWNNVPHMTEKELAARPKKEDWRLQALVVALGERDESGDQSVNLRNVLDVVEDAEMHEEVPLTVRFYAGLGHNHWEHVYNRWPAFHDVIWKGEFEKIFAGARASDELLLRMPSKPAPGIHITQTPDFLDWIARRSPREWWA